MAFFRSNFYGINLLNSVFLGCVKDENRAELFKVKFLFNYFVMSYFAVYE